MYQSVFVNCAQYLFRFGHNPSLEVTGNFLDISRAFDKVQHDGLLYKLESFGISGNLPKLFQSYLNNR